ncbi:N-acetylmuramoyl-L-alanine amidase [Salmonella enterica subsp. enterica]|uniref:N-acetylmuramoyl-L-alanine amidase n=1 Tax=Salmonella enterica I TaxID=59201 RepID=A0A447P5T9_SALET|nr:N-acetylmuramoyl-L-alanine amidase [Salmonella enterica subsp. enterica]
MSTFKLLKTLTSRRQVLKTGLAALTLSGMSHAIAKEETLKTSNGHSKPKTKKTGSKRLVMLDPGHGGIDTGAIGRNGSQEKHVVLAIAKNVRAILRNHGIDARLTRTGDTFIPLYDRVEIAHKHGADLFMSIHADGFTNRKRRALPFLRFPTAGPVAPWRSISPSVKTARTKWRVKKPLTGIIYYNKFCLIWCKPIRLKTV